MYIYAIVSKDRLSTRAINKISTFRAKALSLELVEVYEELIEETKELAEETKGLRSKRRNLVYRQGSETILRYICCYLSATHTGNGLIFTLKQAIICLRFDFISVNIPQ